MNVMQYQNATDVRKNWSTVCDKVSRERPSFIKRTHDLMFLASKDSMLRLLSDVKFAAFVYKEDDGSTTISLKDIDIAENMPNLDAAKEKISESLLSYAEEYLENFTMYSSSKNRSSHLPYVIKTLLLDDLTKIKEEIICQNGKI